MITSTISKQKDNIVKTVNIANYNYQALIQPMLDKKQNSAILFNEEYKERISEFKLDFKLANNELNFLLNTSYFGNQQKKYWEIYDIASENAWKYIKSNNSELIEPLWLFLYNIKLYLHQKDKFYRLSIDLDENLEEPDFKILVMFIETNISNLDEEILLIEEIGDIFDNITTEVLLMKGEGFNEKLAPIVYLFGELDYGLASSSL